jgi:hypothetical protein
MCVRVCVCVCVRLLEARCGIGSDACVAPPYVGSNSIPLGRLRSYPSHLLPPLPPPPPHTHSLSYTHSLTHTTRLAGADKEWISTLNDRTVMLVKDKFHHPEFGLLSEALAADYSRYVALTLSLYPWVSEALASNTLYPGLDRDSDVHPLTLLCDPSLSFSLSSLFPFFIRTARWIPTKTLRTSGMGWRCNGC